MPLYQTNLKDLSNDYENAKIHETTLEILGFSFGKYDHSILHYLEDVFIFLHKAFFLHLTCWSGSLRLPFW